MAYERQNWKTGEVITADKLNHMEEGIATDSSYTIEATFHYDFETDNSYVELAMTGVELISLLQTYKTVFITWEDSRNTFYKFCRTRIISYARKEKEGGNTEYTFLTESSEFYSDNDDYIIGAST